MGIPFRGKQRRFGVALDSAAFWPAPGTPTLTLTLALTLTLTLALTLSSP